MRVVAGELRGRRLLAPDGTDVRPTGDRVREAVFNALGSLEAVVEARVLDLFAGTGALGIEALSRGAAHVTFVEQARPALRTLEANLGALGLTDRARVVRGDALAVLPSLAGPFDLALVDPPYAFDGWDGLLAVLPVPLAVLESDREIAPPAGWGVLRQRRYGGTVVTFIRREDVGFPGLPSSTPGATPP
jgi:16S rRNA (guanine966-N2)-methyltransferase